MHRCLRCKERWSDVKLMTNGVPKRCHDNDCSRIHHDVPVRSIQLKMADYETWKLQAFGTRDEDQSVDFDVYTSSEDGQ